MSIACGVLHWTPETFWSATPHETYAAFDGHALSQGAEDRDGREAEFAAFKRRLEEAGVA